MLAPDVSELLLGEAYGGAEEALAKGALVAQLDQLAHDLVEVGHGRERSGGGAVGRVLEGARRDVLQPVALGGKARSRGGHASSVHPHCTWIGDPVPSRCRGEAPGRPNSSYHA